jgi:nitrous oxide reductase accessory protein NosL
VKLLALTVLVVLGFALAACGSSHDNTPPMPGRGATTSQPSGY